MAGIVRISLPKSLDEYLPPLCSFSFNSSFEKVSKRVFSQNPDDNLVSIFREGFRWPLDKLSKIVEKSSLDQVLRWLSSLLSPELGSKGQADNYAYKSCKESGNHAGSFNSVQ